MAEKDMVGLVDGETTYNFKDAAARIVSGSPANLTQWKKFFTDNFTGTVPKTLILSPTANFSVGNAIASLNATYLFVYRPGKTVATGYYMSYTNVRYDSHGVCTCTLNGATLTLGSSAIGDDISRLRAQYGSVWSFSTLAEIKAALYSMYDETSINSTDIFSSEAPLVFTLDSDDVTFDNGTVIPAYAQVIIYGHYPTDDGYVGIATGLDGTFYTLTTTYPDDSMTINAYAVSKPVDTAIPATSSLDLTSYFTCTLTNVSGSVMEATTVRLGNNGHLSFAFTLNQANLYSANTYACMAHLNAYVPQDKQSALLTALQNFLGAPAIACLKKRQAYQVKSTQAQQNPTSANISVSTPSYLSAQMLSSGFSCYLDATFLAWMLSTTEIGGFNTYSVSGNLFE